MTLTHCGKSDSGNNIAPRWGDYLHGLQLFLDCIQFRWHRCHGSSSLLSRAHPIAQVSIIRFMSLCILSQFTQLWFFITQLARQSLPTLVDIFTGFPQTRLIWVICWQVGGEVVKQILQVVPVFLTGLQIFLQFLRRRR